MRASSGFRKIKKTAITKFNGERERPCIIKVIQSPLAKHHGKLLWSMSYPALLKVTVITSMTRIALKAI